MRSGDSRTMSRGGLGSGSDWWGWSHIGNIDRGKNGQTIRKDLRGRAGRSPENERSVASWSSSQYGFEVDCRWAHPALCWGLDLGMLQEIGRASCRERVEI